MEEDHCVIRPPPFRRPVRSFLANAAQRTATSRGDRHTSAAGTNIPARSPGDSDTAEDGK